MGSVFKRLRRPAVCDVLRKAAYINPSNIPYILFKDLFKYPLYFYVLLLFVKNLKSLLELILYRNVVRELEFRFGLGKHSLNVDYAFVFAELILRKIWCYRIGGKVVARFKGGLISLPDVSYASALTEPFEKMYREVFSFEGRVLDVGGYLGETAFLSKKWGGTEVIVYEPDDIKAYHAHKTLVLNGVKGIVHNCFVNCTNQHNYVPWSEVLMEKFDVAKVDCEGCENGLLSLPYDYIRKIPKWVIECHSSETLRELGEKFLRAGFRVSFKPYMWQTEYHIAGRERSFYTKAEIPQGLLLIMTAYLP
jgi:hypothetical protein